MILCLKTFLVVCFLNAYKSATTPKLESMSKVMGYFGTQSQTPENSRIDVSQIDKKLTHILFAFIIINSTTLECQPLDVNLDINKDFDGTDEILENKDCSVQGKDSNIAKGNYAAMYALKKRHPYMSMILSVGGASDEQAMAFSKATQSDQKITKLVDSCFNIVKDYGLDGLNYDWESPKSENEWKQFTNLVSKTSEKFGDSKEKEYSVSSALFTTAFKNNDSIASMELVASKLNFITLMTYDGAPGSDQSLNDSPLLKSQEAPYAMNVESALEEVEKYFSPSQIIVGTPLYGHLQKVSQIKSDTEKTRSGLYNPIDKSVTIKSISYNEISKNYTKKNGFTENWDDVSKSSYLFNKETLEFLTYTNERAIDERIDYLKKQKAGGIFFWRLGNSYDKSTKKELLVEYAVGKIEEKNIDYRNYEVCAPHSKFCNIHSECKNGKGYRESENNKEASLSKLHSIPRLSIIVFTLFNILNK